MDDPPVNDVASTLPGQAPDLTAGLGQTFGTIFEANTWQAWVTLFLAILAGLIVGKIVQSTLRGASARLKARGWEVRGIIIEDLAMPAYLALFAFGLTIGFGALTLPPEVREFAGRVLKFLYILPIALFLYNLVDVAELALKSITARTESKLDDQLVPLIRKALRIFLVIVFTLFIAENVFQADITAWLAGLGIAGLAVSLSAQDSIKNIFGSITILLDRPFAVGDRISFDNFDGMVEEIGFRSTKMRTLVGHVVTIPNSKIVDGSVENIARRPHIRRMLDVTITYDTPPEKVEQAVQIIRDILADPEIAPAFGNMEKFPPRVNFDEFNADSLNIKVFYWFYPNDYWRFLEHAQKFNMKLLRAFEEAEIEFAFPTRTLYLAGDPKRQISIRSISDEGMDGKPRRGRG